ncbi:2-oxoglutarate and iron-dependent oxygenase domain-containing protein 3 isoform X3 [Petaurus breviceps papuanus]|uniref:2-oxoglutarate and iron-dependent oxygenase domain-containing protein 3 isoform X3 n=2 Tax=Petaurus breviceps papuanus TaxID=3040969 RepID=UPI0036DC35FA
MNPEVTSPPRPHSNFCFRAGSWGYCFCCGLQLGVKDTPLYPPLLQEIVHIQTLFSLKFQKPGMYMQVETRTGSLLHLKRSPGIRSWSLLVDNLGWKFFYVTGCLFVAVQNLEDWEEALFDKTTGKVILKTFNLYKKILTASRVCHEQVVVGLNDIQDVNVIEEKVRYFGKGYTVVLRFATGFSHPLTQSAVMGHRSIKKNRIHHESQRKWLKISFWGSSGLLASLFLWSFLNGDDGITEVLAHHNEILQNRFIEVICSDDYDSHKRFEGCTPRKCGRGITDIVITREEAEQLRRIAEKALSLGGSEGGASILDLHSGALSFGKHFVNLYRYFGAKIQDIFSEEDFQLYRDVRQKIQHTIGQAFDINISSIYLTKPTFFSRINSTEAKTTHDEYWHPHIDKTTYGSFDYTSLLYLSDYMEDFGGGRFVFMEEGLNKAVEPRAGRVSFFTSGSENLHHVEKVRWGTRYAITISFTCNPDHGIGDPAFF